MIIDYLQNKLLINILFRNIGVEIRGLDESQKELVNNLQVRPSHFKDRLVLFWVISVSDGVKFGWKCSE
jgi:hypothetical protein